MKKRKNPPIKDDYPSDVSALISGYEKDSRDAEAKLADARKKQARKEKTD